MRHTVPLPETWTEASLRDIAWNLRPRSNPSEHPGLRFVGMDNVEAQTTRLLGTVPASIMKSTATHFQPGDVLYGRLRPYLNKVFTAQFEGLASAEFIPLTTPAGVHPEFVKYRLNSAEFVAFTSRLDTGDRPRVDYEQIADFRVSLPPSGEQHRIVEAIESYLTRLDNAGALLERVEENLKRYRASVLKAAVEGRLVPTEAELARREGRTSEPAGDLLKRILAERKARWIEDAAEKARAKAEEKARKTGKPWTAKDNAAALDKERAKAAKQHKEPAAPDTNGLRELPEGWCWAGPEQVSSGEQYAIGIGPFGSNLLVTDYTDSGVPLVFVRNIRAELFGTEEDHYISAEKAAELRPHWVEPGDVLITKMGEPPGDACLYPPSRRTAVITADCIRLRLHPAAGSPKYIVYAVRSYGVRTQIAAMTKGVAQKKVSLARFKGLAIPFPPVSEQLRLVSELDRVNAVCEAVGREVRVNIVRGQRLRQSILKWAFEGKLVEQDPNDEPASALLERIRAERAATGAGESRARKRRGAE